MNPLQYCKNLKETLSKEDPVYIIKSSEGLIDFIGLFSEITPKIINCEDITEKIDRVYYSITRESQLDTADKYCKRLIFACGFSDDVYFDLDLYHYTKKVEYRNKVFNEINTLHQQEVE